MKEYKYKINGNAYKVAIGDIENGIAQVEVNGTPYNVEFEKKETVKTVVAPRPSAAPRTQTGEKVITKPAPAAGGAQVKAPLPGVVVSVSVKVGDTVKASDTVVVLEAMKMENAIHAGRDGKVAAVNVNAGDSVLEGAALITLE
ncbi:MAG: biotin/lipoyl-binding protein [Muribaculaceae bacterium]|nr:biotin/lipoyl-binding protein [Muribaculaceae bacterium]MBQ3606606.1 biotin/lipoyl-binding protein [Muribaculaceae bacterium]MBQ7853473.1 biotin/lipoyl-binding protein [Muribaculaceae bacterium]MBQ7855399.1 biotin/lipoyl-binding protein [Muribaculaceae bacterium]MBR3829722.1 biotin/lipoyl-binding protein [Muribaculaceae bacterium]